MTEIRHARFPDDLELVKAIFREYVQSASVSLEFQDYESEFAALPGKSAPPRGRLLPGWRDDTVLGCVALRQVDARTCEMKRVFVRPEARGENLGRRLVERVLSEARAAGYTRMCLDVLPEFTAAQRLYESLGFTSALPITHNPVPGTKFLGLDL